MWPAVRVNESFRVASRQSPLVQSMYSRDVRQANGYARGRMAAKDRISPLLGVALTLDCWTRRTGPFYRPACINPEFRPNPA